MEINTAIKFVLLCLFFFVTLKGEWAKHLKQSIVISLICGAVSLGILSSI